MYTPNATVTSNNAVIDAVDVSLSLIRTDITYETGDKIHNTTPIDKNFVCVGSYFVCFSITKP